MSGLIIAMTGATGAIMGVRLLGVLREHNIETHLILSRWAQRTIEHETSFTVEQVRELASANYGPGDMGAAISSGSFRTDGMIVIPCSMRTLASIAHGNGDSLVHRAADVIIKEHRRLVLVTRETPLSDIHLENMLKLSRMGITISPPMPAFYNHPQSIEDIIDHLVARVLDQFSIDTRFAKRWDGQMHQHNPTRPPSTAAVGVRD